MPELPEVETIRRVLEPYIKGLTIAAVTVNRRSVIGHPTAEGFCQAITGQTIAALRIGLSLLCAAARTLAFEGYLHMGGCLFPVGVYTLRTLVAVLTLGFVELLAGSCGNLDCPPGPVYHRDGKRR